MPLSTPSSEVATLLMPYQQILTELEFKLAWNANLPHVTRERYEREMGKGDARARIWIFLEGNDSEVSWTIGWDATSAYDMVASSTAQAYQELDPPMAFKEELLRLLVARPTAFSPLSAAEADSWSQRRPVHLF
jgi:hypothetical protein